MNVRAKKWERIGAVALGFLAGALLATPFSSWRGDPNGVPSILLPLTAAEVEMISAAMQSGTVVVAHD